MTYLFFVQGEGRGHMTQAISLAQALEHEGHQVSEVFLGVSPQRKIPAFFSEYFNAKLRFFKSPNFISTSDKKGINFPLSLLYNFLRIPIYITEIFRLAAIIRKSDAERIINFYEMIGGLAHLFSFSGKKYFVISHHYFFNHPDFKWPGKFNLQRYLISLFSFMCALGAEKKIALSFSESKDLPARRIKIVPPLLRKEVYQLSPVNKEYILIYLLNPGFIEDIISWCEKNSDKKIIAFTDRDMGSRSLPPNLIPEILQGKQFLDTLAGCEYLFCTSGFETVSEAALLGKRIFVIPSRNHYEQKCNAADAERTGIAEKLNELDLSRADDNLLKISPEKLVRSWFLRNPGMILETILK